MAGLKNVSDTDLLAELLRRNPPQVGPRSVVFAPEKVMVATIGIGKDHSASIYLHQDDIDALPVLASR